jgi:hypothetical protein
MNSAWVSSWSSRKARVKREMLRISLRERPPTVLGARGVVERADVGQQIDGLPRLAFFAVSAIDAGLANSQRPCSYFGSKKQTGNSGTTAEVRPVAGWVKVVVDMAGLDQLLDHGLKNSPPRLDVLHGVLDRLDRLSFTSLMRSFR